MKKLVSLLITMLLLASVPITAMATSEAEQLKKDFAIIARLEEREYHSFLQENAQWVADVNNRLSAYLLQFPEEERDAEIRKLVGRTARSNIGLYFDWTAYEYRGAFWTYSMAPTMITRTLWFVAEMGWKELVNKYPAIDGPDGSSLYAQYACHYTVKIDAEWNLETGVPYVDYPENIGDRCNPRW
jgi:hypothetical protein